jgi:type IX secretion system PorP/SprF family membrane protein
LVALEISEIKNMPLMKRSIVAIMLLFCFANCDDVFGQQEAQFSHNMFNNMGINPGFAGLRNAICATALARQQYVGFRDVEGNSLSPETYSFTVDAPVPFLKGGLALGFIQDQQAFETALGVKLGYAYHLQMDYGTMGIGGQIGFLDKRFDFSGFKPITEGDPALVASDEESAMILDGALGVFYKLDKAWAGLSISQLAQGQKQIGTAEYKTRRHLYLAAGYHYTLPGYTDFVLSPSFLFKSDLTALQRGYSFQTDFNSLITYRERFWGGLSYRLQDAAVIFLGLTIEQISIGYSYDITLSPLGRSGRSWGSHEIFVQYCFALQIDKIQQTHRNVRFL